MGAKFLEEDLYLPISEFFTGLGFDVKGEVKNCDMVAVKDDVFVIIELKKSFSLKLVYQAIERQALSKEVFVGIPRPLKGQNTRAWKSMMKLLKRIDVGLITVAMDSPIKTVEILLSPIESFAWKNQKKRSKLEKEFNSRVSNSNIGGVKGKKIITAYREKAVELCCILEKSESVSIKELRTRDISKEQIRMLAANYYGWFTRVEKGVYCLSELGRDTLNDENMSRLVEFYRCRWV